MSSRAYKDSTLMLVDASTGAPLWSQATSEAEGLDGLPYVHDSGWVVAVDGASVVGLAPEDGRVAFRIPRIDGADPGDRARLGHSDCGPFLVGVMREYFAEVAGRLYFVVRTDWGGFHAVDVAAGRLALPLPADLVAGLEAEERRFVRGVLSGALARLRGLPDRDRSAAEIEVRQAMELAVRDRITEVLPDVEALEAWSETDSSTGSSCPAPDGIWLDSQDENSMRRTAQWTLRRLGGRPSGASALVLKRGPDFGPVADPLASVRDRKPDDLRAGMLPSDVLKAAGAPDVVDRCTRKDAEGVACRGDLVLHPYWDYFLDVDPPAAVRLWWGKDGRVRTIERTAPSWLDQGPRPIRRCPAP